MQWHEKEIKGIKIGKEEMKLYMIICRKYERTDKKTPTPGTNNQL